MLLCTHSRTLKRAAVGVGLEAPVTLAQVAGSPGHSLIAVGIVCTVLKLGEGRGVAMNLLLAEQQNLFWTGQALAR